MPLLSDRQISIGANVISLALSTLVLISGLHEHTEIFVILAGILITFNLVMLCIHLCTWSRTHES